MSRFPVQRQVLILPFGRDQSHIWGLTRVQMIAFPLVPGLSETRYQDLATCHADHEEASPGTWNQQMTPGGEHVPPGIHS